MRKACLALVAAIALTGVVVAADDYTEPYVVSGSQVTPDFPPAAKAAGFQGAVTVAAVINSDGSVGVVEVVNSSSSRLGFEEAALDAMRQWQFAPARVNGEPVDSVYAYVFHFRSPGRGMNAGAYVAGDFLVSRLVAPGVAVAGSKSLAGVTVGPGFSPSATVEDYLKKPSLPPACEGCIYDRTKLLPPKDNKPDGSTYMPIKRGVR